MIRLALFALALAVCASLIGYGIGRKDGRALAEASQNAALARAQAATMRAAEQASRIEASRLALEAERDALARNLEDLAHDDPDTAGGLPVGRVERLRKR